MQKVRQKLYFISYSVYYKHTYVPEYKKKHVDGHSKTKKKSKQI